MRTRGLSDCSLGTWHDAGCRLWIFKAPGLSSRKLPHGTQKAPRETFLKVSPLRALAKTLSFDERWSVTPSSILASGQLVYPVLFSVNFAERIFSVPARALASGALL